MSECKVTVLPPVLINISSSTEYWSCGQVHIQDRFCVQSYCSFPNPVSCFSSKTMGRPSICERPDCPIQHLCKFIRNISTSIWDPISVSHLPFSKQSSSSTHTLGAAPRAQSSASYSVPNTRAAHSLCPFLLKVLLGEVASYRKGRGVKLPVLPGGASGERFTCLVNRPICTVVSEYGQ
jgi:hypothetical protein